MSVNKKLHLFNRDCLISIFNADFYDGYDNL